MIQFENAQIDWFINKAEDLDNVTCILNGAKEVYDIRKTRPDDFHSEIRHIQAVLEGSFLYEESPINIKYGIDTMFVICAIFRSIREKKPVKINYDEE